MNINYLGTGFFTLALIHTFLVSVFAKISRRFPEDSALESFFHLLSEVEIVFGFWAFLFLSTWAVIAGPSSVIQYQQSLNMSEPLFIFCIMILASTRPIVSFARNMILKLSHFLFKILKINQNILQFFCLLTLGPLLGAGITEPAAITVVALLLYRMIDIEKVEEVFLYGIIGLLFVNISVGGATTHFAAPPILMVARIWHWNWSDVFFNLGLAAIATVFVNAFLFSFIFRKKISNQLQKLQGDNYPIPKWVTSVHILFLVAIIATVHYEKIFFGIFLIFMGLTTVTRKYQDGLKFKESFLVSFFLAGLIVFGAFQQWWLEPIMKAVSEKALFLSTVILTAITDNAALTFLGAQVPGLSEASKWALVSGALAGGGLTILANAPNPAGFAILSAKFPNKSLNALKLFLAALIPTLVAIAFFFIFGNF